jgi:hypothetical protein
MSLARSSGCDSSMPSMIAASSSQPVKARRLAEPRPTSNVDVDVDVPLNADTYDVGGSVTPSQATPRAGSPAQFSYTVTTRAGDNGSLGIEGTSVRGPVAGSLNATTSTPIALVFTASAIGGGSISYDEDHPPVIHPASTARTATITYLGAVSSAPIHWSEAIQIVKQS